jgi:hypothetical protein
MYPGTAPLHVLAMTNMTDVIHRGSHLTMAEIAAESEFRAARPGDSFEEVFRKADLAAFYEAPK